MKANYHIDARIAQVQRMRMPLASVPDNCDCLVLKRRKTSVLLIKSSCHFFVSLEAVYSARWYSKTSSCAAPRGTGGERRSFLLSSGIEMIPDRVTSISP